MVMADHVITISLEEDAKKKKHARPAPATLNLIVDDTVTYQSAEPGDVFEVIFDGSPFSDRPALVISDSTPLTVKRPGRYFSKCFITRDGERFGWSADEDPKHKSGGDQDVKPKPETA
jgi:hypothetical protein